MPDIGTISKAVEIGYPNYGRHKMIWAACQSCAQERWTLCRKGLSAYPHCRPCSGAIKAGRTPSVDLPGGLRTCSTCSLVKAMDAFPQRAAGVRRKTCQACRTEAMRSCRQANPEAARARAAAYRKRRPEVAKAANLKNLYGLTLLEYEAMLASQEHLCAICHQSETVALSVDHNHQTGAVRGLLCGNCNRMIGLAGEDIARLLAAVAYLEKHSPEHLGRQLLAHIQSSRQDQAA